MCAAAAAAVAALAHCAAAARSRGVFSFEVGGKFKNLNSLKFKCQHFYLIRSKIYNILTLQHQNSEF